MYFIKKEILDINGETEYLKRNPKINYRYLGFPDEQSAIVGLYGLLRDFVRQGWRAERLEYDGFTVYSEKKEVKFTVCDCSEALLVDLKTDPHITIYNE